MRSIIIKLIQLQDCNKPNFPLSQAQGRVLTRTLADLLHSRRTLSNMSPLSDSSQANTLLSFLHSNTGDYF